MQKKRILPAVLAILIAGSAGIRTDLEDLSARFFRRLFRREEVRAVFGVSEEEIEAVFAPWDEETRPL